MLISYNWLQNYFEEKLPNPEKIAEGIIFHSFEIEEIKKVLNDTIFDIKILPDRAHDCLSHWGIAKEISVIFDIPIKKEKISSIENLSTSDLKVEVKDEKCRRYIGQIIKNVKIGPSPKWLKEKLETIGQRSINNIVDATNYIMFDLGNPIHAFDLDKLESHTITVESAKDGEKMVLLDGKEVTLDSSVLTIRDEKDALAIAGIKGGKKAEIDENTKNIIIEVANFDPVSTRKTAKKLNIFTDSSKRFENEISPRLADLAIEKISNFIVEVAGGEKFEGLDVYKNKVEEKIVQFDIEYVNKLLGVSLEEKDVDIILDRFGYSYRKEGSKYKVILSYLRIDISGPYDMAEEIGRIYGYDKIIPQLPKISSEKKDDLVWQKINLAKNKLINDGYKEVMTYAFGSNGEVEVLASASDKKFLRTDISSGIKKSYELNKINLPLLELDEVKIFEIGTVFKKSGEQINVCWADKNGIQEMELNKFVEEKIHFEASSVSSDAFSQVLGRGGREPVPDHSKKHTDSTSQNIYNKNEVFKPWSIYPFITRDIAVWVPEGTKPEELSKIYKELGTDLLIREPKLFDQFTKPASDGQESKVSYAFRLVFQSYEKTLTDDEINVIMSNIEKQISSLGWKVR